MKLSVPVKQFLLGFCVILATLLITVIIIFYLAMKPRLDDEKLASQLAIKKANLTQTTKIDLYNGSATYYSVYGTTKSGVPKIVSVNQDDGTISVYNQNSGVSRKVAQARAVENGATTISKIVVGIENKTPVWEVRANNGYYLINFKNGKFLKKEGI